MRLRLPVFIFAIIFSTVSFAAPAPLPEGVKVERDLQYVPGGDPSQALDLYLPEKPADKPQPLILWFHGGAWVTGSKAFCGSISMVPRGYIAGSVEYRFSQKAIFPAQIQDCQAAIRWLRANSKKYNIDPNHIGVWGSSAGGHLVALLGTAGGKKAFPSIGGNEDQSDRVQAVCDLFGPADFNTVVSQAAADTHVKNAFNFSLHSDPYAKLIGVGLGEDKDKADAVSPMRYVSKDNPPILIMHGTLDNLVPFAQSEELYDASIKAGVDATFQKFPGTGHGGPAFNLPAVRELAEKFFDKHLKGIDAKIEPLPESAVIVAPKPAPGK